MMANNAWCYIYIGVVGHGVCGDVDVLESLWVWCGVWMGVWSGARE